MIEVEHLTKDYGSVVAVRDVSFSVGKGEVVGFLGPNGAGKSTTLRILAGFLGATSGTVRINGFDIIDRSLEARSTMGYMPEAAPLYPEMRVREYLAFRAAVKRVPRKERGKAVDRAMRLAAVVEMADTLILHLSKGYRQRVGLADALVASPPLLILDEPTAGLDPNQIREVRKVVRELGQNHTILLSTHILSEVESTCDRALVIDRGRLVAEGSIDELRAMRRSDSILVSLRDPDGRGAKVMTEIAGVRRVRKLAAATAKATPSPAEGRRPQPESSASPAEGRRPQPESSDGLARFKILLEPSVGDMGEVLERVVSALVSAGIGVREAAPSKASLEEVFAELTRAEEKQSDEHENGEEQTP